MFTNNMRFFLLAFSVEIHRLFQPAQEDLKYLICTITIMLL